MSRPSSRAAAFGLVAAAYAATLGWSASVLPDRVPIHFGVLGEPDRVVDRGGALALLAGTGAGVAVLLGLLPLLVSVVPITWVNLPDKDWWTQTPAREDRLRRILAEATWALAAWTMLLLLAVLLLVVAAARAADRSLSPWSWLVPALWLVGLGLGVRRLVLRTRPPGSGGPAEDASG